jgi:hypothetical protein
MRGATALGTLRDGAVHGRARNTFAPARLATMISPKLPPVLKKPKTY